MSSTCAYLGPNGSYTSQAALSLLPTSTLHPFHTIASVFAAETTHAVVPLENTIHGVVQETLACLLGPEREGWRVVKTYDKGIQHALVVANGTRMEDIRWVASHEQALGQCASFLRTYIPSAQLVPLPSTALAAHTVHSLSLPTTNGTPRTNANGQEEDTPIPPDLRALPGAAICSVELADALEGLEVMERGVQDVKENYTRFLLLRRDTYSQEPSSLDVASSDNANASAATTFYRIDDPQTLTTLLRNPSTALIATHSRAFPPHPATKANGHRNNSGLQKAQETYIGMYNKRYLVEVAGEVVDVPGAVRL